MADTARVRPLMTCRQLLRLAILDALRVDATRAKVPQCHPTTPPKFCRGSSSGRIGTCAAEATRLRLIKPILVGPVERIRSAANEVGFDIGGVERVDASMEGSI